MRLDLLLFGLLLAMCGVVVAAFFVAEPQAQVQGELVSAGHGVLHPVFKSMDKSVTGAQPDGIIGVGWSFGIIQIVFFLCCLALGMRKAGRSRPILIPIFLGGTVYLAVFTAMVLSYRAYAAAPEHTMFLSFPRPTAWMLYGVWLFPLYFIALYIAMFNRWTLTGEDTQRLSALLAARAEQGGENV